MSCLVFRHHLLRQLDSVQVPLLCLFPCGVKQCHSFEIYFYMHLGIMKDVEDKHRPENFSFHNKYPSHRSLHLRNRGRHLRQCQGKGSEDPAAALPVPSTPSSAGEGAAAQTRPPWREAMPALRKPRRLLLPAPPPRRAPATGASPVGPRGGR